MKATDSFTKTISAHLEGVAKKDVLFAQTLKKPNKKIEDCINYILNTVQKSGKNGFNDDEIFAMAIHYYDEDDIATPKEIKAKVIVNHAKGDATSPDSPKSSSKSEQKKKSAPLNQPTLFG
jgi:hypothetical protein